jgi:5-formyltetrahydrofolate cyclo-ligase
MHVALTRGKKCYLPVIDGSNRLRFARYRPGNRLTANRFGIAEPTNGECIPAWALQLVITPLVGFDKLGGRLGMGGGFYDRCFAFKRGRKVKKPFLLGFAHSLQEVDKLELSSRDIPLQGVVTEKELRLF